MTLTEFLLARVAEDEADARLAVRCHEPGEPWGWDTVPGDGLHIARWDPARVLAECEAKRRIVEEWRETEALLLARSTGIDQELHERQAHPAWEYATTETARKSGESVRPDGDGWEPNNIVCWTGPDGVQHCRNWERYEFTESEFWRRLRPEPRDTPPNPPFHLKCLALPYATHPEFQDSWRVDAEG